MSLSKKVALALICPIFAALPFISNAEKGVIHFVGAIVMEGCKTHYVGSTINASCLTTDSTTTESVAMAVKTGNVANLRRISIQAIPLASNSDIEGQPKRYIVQMDYH